MAQLGGHAAFIESKTTQIAHGDTPKEIGEIFGRYFDGIAIAMWTGAWEWLFECSGKGITRACAQYAMRYLPSFPDPG